VKVHGILDADLAEAGDAAQQAEEVGYDGLWVSEIAHDPFLPLLLAAGRTANVELGTAIAVAYPRSPMHLAHTAWDLHRYSGGRFILGLGSQVRAHVERRYSASFDRPVARMRELVLAIRAIWHCWQNDAPLNFRGEFYTHTLMTPFFHPGPSPYGPPKIFIAAVGPKMTEVAGEVADGVFVHGLTSDDYIRSVTLPSLQRGLERAGRKRGDIDVCRPLFLVTGVDDAERTRATAGVRDKLAFYASTPTYRDVLALHGWEALQGELAMLARANRWKDMSALIDDDMLRTFAVVADLANIPAQIAARFSGLVDRVSFNAPFRDHPQEWGEVLAGISAA
jgi:probable F420-dependent oxidoreductase